MIENPSVVSAQSNNVGDSFFDLPRNPSSMLSVPLVRLDTVVPDGVDIVLFSAAAIMNTTAREALLVEMFRGAQLTLSRVKHLVWPSCVVSIHSHDGTNMTKTSVEVEEISTSGSFQTYGGSAYTPQQAQKATSCKSLFGFLKEAASKT